MPYRHLLLCLALGSGLVATCGGSGDAASPSPVPTPPSESPYPTTPLLENGLRNKYKWPFESDSIWNTPIGDAASYVLAGIGVPRGMGMTVDEDVIIQRPWAPLKPILLNDAGWDREKTRCGSVRPGTLLYPDPLPVPDDFSTDPGYLGLTPNMSAAILMPDGQTIRQTQPFHVCEAGGPVTSQYRFGSENIVTGSGIEGAHGGSGMSSLGGTVRVGELVPGGVVRHALKVNLFGQRNYSYASSDSTPGYRWPAQRADAYAGDPESPCAYGGAVRALQMGALLALRPEYPIESLRTEPARILARALRDYGAYVVDDTCWDVYALATEWGPDGRVTDEFQAAWGFPLQTAALSTCSGAGLECQWARDMAQIFTALHVVDDNGPDAVGGAGGPRAPRAPPVGN